MGRHFRPADAFGRGLHWVWLRLNAFFGHPERPRWLGLAIFATLVALFAFSRPPTPSLNPCHVPHLPESMDIVYCGQDLIAATVRLTSDLVVVYDARDRSRSWPHSFVSTSRKTASQAHTKITEIALKGASDRLDVLVLGLGGGAIPYLITEQCSECYVVGVDISSDALHIARMYVKADDDPHLQYIQQDAEIYAKSSQSASYDVIVVDLSVGQVTPEFVFLQPFAGNIHRLLRPGGKAIVSLFLTPDTDHHKLQMFSVLSKFFQSVNIVELDEHERDFVLQATK